MLKFIQIDGRRYAWQEILRLRREQSEADRRVQQPTLFELRDDRRPSSQQTPRGRYEQLTLVEMD